MTFFKKKTILPPSDALWGVRPVKCQIGSFSYCMSYALYTKYVHICKTGACGDFDFISRVYHSEEKPKVVWMEDIFVSTQNAPSYGNAEGVSVISNIDGKERRIIRRSHRVTHR